MKVTVRKTETVSVKAEENVKEPLLTHPVRPAACQPSRKTEGPTQGNGFGLLGNAESRRRSGPLDAPLRRCVDCTWEGELAEAIVKMAIHDYIDALQTLAVNPKDEDALLMLDDCRDFFRGEWCAQLSPIDGELIIELVDGVMR